GPAPRRRPGRAPPVRSGARGARRSVGGPRRPVEGLLGLAAVVEPGIGLERGAGGGRFDRRAEESVRAPAALAVHDVAGALGLDRRRLALRLPDRLRRRL